MGTEWWTLDVKTELASSFGKYLNIISITYVWIFSVALFFQYQIRSDLVVASVQ